MSVADAQSLVTIESSNGTFRLLRNGKPFPIRGVGGDVHLDKLAAAGGNAIRTWDSEELGETLDKAKRHGLMVCAGLWLGHQRHGFDYQDQAAVLEQLDEQLAYVREHKDHPALLMWAVGNEMEGEGNDPSVWYAVNHVAREIKQIDPNHPTMTVIAELGEEASKLASIERFCPDIDIIGLNSYGGVESIGDRYVDGGSSKPYIITEHGPVGPWEIEKTSWGSPIEQTSTEKAKFYARGFQDNVVKHADVCLGSFAFLWGHKQETTATWFGMLLPDGTRLGAVDSMEEAWKGVPPKNRCPEIRSLEIDKSASLEPGEQFTASVSVSDPESDKLSIKWVLRTDAGEIGSGGDPQDEEDIVEGAVRSKGDQAVVTVPDDPGGYRLFAYVYDGRGGAAVANVPFRTAGKIKLKSEMPVAMLPYVVYGDDAKADNVFTPSGYMGNVQAVSMQLNCTDEPYSGRTCIKVDYKSPRDWGGVLWQSPAEDWDGESPGGANLTGATHLAFRVRGAEGGEVVNFVFGVLDGKQAYPDTAKGELKDVKLTKEWAELKFPLKDLDLRQIKTGFGWSLAGQGQPVTFYLDDIQYVQE